MCFSHPARCTPTSRIRYCCLLDGHWAKEDRTVHGGYYPAICPAGTWSISTNGTLFAVPFDLKQLEVAGQPAPILEGVATNVATWRGAILLFRCRKLSPMLRGACETEALPSIGWTRQASSRPCARLPPTYAIPRSPPTGSVWLWRSTTVKETDIWVYEWERDTLTRLTFAGEVKHYPRLDA